MRGVLLAIVGATLAACGTTVPASQVASSTGDSGLGSTSQNGESLSVPGGAAAVPGTIGSGSVTGPAATGGMSAAVGSTRASGTTASGSAASGGAGTPAPSGPVEVGIEYFNSTQAVNAGKAVGYSVSPGDPYAEAQALVAWVNKHGGLGGHQIRPVYFRYDNSTTPDTNEQAACAMWTQDHHVVAAIWPNNFSPDNVLATCLHQKGVMLTGGADTYLNSPQLQAMGGYLQTPYMIAGDRMYSRLIDRLVATGWFGSGSKIGVLSDEGPLYAANVQTIKQRLASHGLAVTDSATLSTTSPGLDSSQCQSAGLHFAAQHITNIVVADDGARVFLYCTPVFRSQNYSPKFSITSYDSPSTVKSLVPASSLKGSAGIGWEPVNDVTGFTPNASGKLCLSIMREAGQNVAAAALEEAIAFAYCDGFFFFKRAYVTATNLSPADVQRQISALGAGYVSPITFRTYFAPGHYDGTDAAADLTYVSSCSCYRYAGSPKTIR